MRSWHKGAFLLIVLLCFLAGAVCLSLFTGSSSLSLGELYHALQVGDKTDTTYRIFLYVRLPRTLAAIFAGAALAVSGAIIQAVLNNSLASPNIIGVNSGAGFCALLAASLAPTAWAAVPLAAFVGGSCHQFVHLRFGGKNRGIPYDFSAGWCSCQQYIVRRY